MKSQALVQKLAFKYSKKNALYLDSSSSKQHSALQCKTAVLIVLKAAVKLTQDVRSMKPLQLGPLVNSELFHTPLLCSKISAYQ